MVIIGTTISYRSPSSPFPQSMSLPATYRMCVNSSRVAPLCVQYQCLLLCVPVGLMTTGVVSKCNVWLPKIYGLLVTIAILCACVYSPAHNMPHRDKKIGCCSHRQICVSTGGRQHCPRLCFMISLLDGGIRSGNTTWNSTIKSPRWAEFLARGSPSPISLLTEPGLMTSLQGTGLVWPSRVGTLTVHPHNAYRKRKRWKRLV